MTSRHLFVLNKVARKVARLSPKITHLTLRFPQARRSGDNQNKCPLHQSSSLVIGKALLLLEGEKSLRWFLYSDCDSGRGKPTKCWSLLVHILSTIMTSHNEKKNFWACGAGERRVGEWRGFQVRVPFCLKVRIPRCLNFFKPPRKTEVLELGKSCITRLMAQKPTKHL